MYVHGIYFYYTGKFEHHNIFYIPIWYNIYICISECVIFHETAIPLLIQMIPISRSWFLHSCSLQCGFFGNAYVQRAFLTSIKYAYALMIVFFYETLHTDICQVI